MDAQGTMRLMFDTMDAYDRADFDRLAEIYASRDAALWRSRTTPQWRPPKQRSWGKAQRQPTADGTGGGFDGDPVGRLIDGGGQRSSDAALSANCSLLPITVAPESTGRGGFDPQVASRSNSRKKS